MWQERQADKLKDEIEALLTTLPNVAGLYNLIKEPLTQAKRELSDSNANSHPWHLLPLIVCESISGHYEHALPAAVTRQLLIAAAEVFDDIEDADSSISLSTRHGSAVAINVAASLLILAEKAITRLQGRGVEDNIIIRVMDAINSFYITACAGQHLDLSISLETTISEDIYLKVIEMKSASQVECACYIGALLANANQELINKFSWFGNNLGMASQIANDIRGIIHGCDITKRKITLPVIYALTQTDSEARNQLSFAFSKQSQSAPNPKEIMDLLFHTGAIYYATIKTELYKQQALDILYEIEATGTNIKRLKLFLE